MDPFVVIAFNEYHKMESESHRSMSSSSSLNSLDTLYERVPSPAPVSAPAPVHIRTPKVAFAYPSPVFNFVYKRRRYVLLFFLVGFVTLKQKELRRMLSQ